jgi:hypothetical protein
MASRKTSVIASRKTSVMASRKISDMVLTGLLYVFGDVLFIENNMHLTL